MSGKFRAVATLRKAFSILKENSNMKVGMSSKCEAKSLSQPIDPACCPAKCLMDEAPEPCGDWKENYDRCNAKDTKIMIGGTVIFLVSCFLVKRDGLIKGYPYSSIFI